MFHGLNIRNDRHLCAASQTKVLLSIVTGRKSRIVQTTLTRFIFVI